MAVYKVPQDVEADDKLIGPFSFRQFIYLIIVTLAIMTAWGLAQLFVPLAIIPLPVIIFFGALALPLRKDQPMEIYMAAMVSYHLKPRRRMWDADGIESLIEITTPKTVEVQRVKNLSQDEAQERLGYLADIVDSKGWAVRGQGVQAPNNAINNDVYFEAQAAEDVLDNSTSVAQSLDFMINQSDAKRHQAVIDQMHQPPTPSVVKSTPAPITPNPYDYFANPQSTVATAPAVVGQSPTYNPYPTNIQQAVIQPIGTTAPLIGPAKSENPRPVSVVQTPPQTTSVKPVSAGIINLANNADLSIATIAREAHRIAEQDSLNEEVVISLR